MWVSQRLLFAAILISQVMGEIAGFNAAPALPDFIINNSTIIWVVCLVVGVLCTYWDSLEIREKYSHKDGKINQFAKIFAIIAALSFSFIMSLSTTFVIFFTKRFSNIGAIEEVDLLYIFGLCLLTFLVVPIRYFLGLGHWLSK